MSEEEIVTLHEEKMEGDVDAFASAVEKIFLAAKRRVLLRLIKKWSDDPIRRIQAIDEVPQELDAALTDSGYHTEVDLFVEKMSQQIDDFANIYEAQQERIQELPDLAFDKEDESQFSLFIEGAISSLDSISDSFVNEVRALLPTLYATSDIEEVSNFLDSKTPSDVGLIALLFIASFFRLVSDTAYGNAEDEVGKDAHYRYAGPVDSKNRDFCAGILHGGGTYRRAEIEQMDNGQIPNVFVSGGGYGCRHWWELGGFDARQ